MLKRCLVNISLTVNWRSAKLRSIKLASICKTLLRGFLNLPSFETNLGEEGFSPHPTFFEVLSSSLPGVQGHSFRHALEMFVLVRLRLPVLVQERSIPLRAFLRRTV